KRKKNNHQIRILHPRFTPIGFFSYSIPPFPPVACFFNSPNMASWRFSPTGYTPQLLSVTLLLGTLSLNSSHTFPPIPSTLTSTISVLSIYRPVNSHRIVPVYMSYIGYCLYMSIAVQGRSQSSSEST